MKFLRTRILTTGFLFCLLFQQTVRAFYDPSAQSWINRDPIQEHGGLNLYGFVQSDPMNRADSYGECPLVLPILAGLGLVGEGAGITAVGSAIATGAGALVGSALTSTPAGMGHASSPPIGLSLVNSVPAGPIVFPTTGPGRGNPGERKQQDNSPNPDKTRGKPDNQTGKKPNIPKPPEPPKGPPPRKPNDQDDWWNRPPWNESPPKDLCPHPPSPGPLN